MAMYSRRDFLDVIADGSTYPASRIKQDQNGKWVYTPIDRSANTELRRMMAHCRKVVPRKQLKGFVVCPWVTTTPGVQREVLLDSISYAGEEFARFEKDLRQPGKPQP